MRCAVTLIGEESDFTGYVEASGIDRSMRFALSVDCVVCVLSFFFGPSPFFLYLVVDATQLLFSASLSIFLSSDATSKRKDRSGVNSVRLLFIVCSFLFFRSFCLFSNLLS